MPTPEQIRTLINEAVSALEGAERDYQTALQNYRNGAEHDSQVVDRALEMRDLARLAVQLAKELQLPP